MATTHSDNSRRRQQERKHFPFHTFATPAGPLVDFRGLFRHNIRRLLQECGEIEDHASAGTITWSISLVVGVDRLVLPLYVVEEHVEHSPHPFCNHCKCIGWGHHFVSKRRYHFVIPAVEELENSFHCQFLHLRSSHLLHALIHCNGFGHLLSVNRIQCGSTFLGETDFMHFWDRICTILRTRKISVSDNLKRGTIELRLLQNAAQGRTWLGSWGYKFSNGTSGVTEDDYNMAVHILSTLELDKISYDFRNTKLRSRLMRIIQKYRGLSNTQLITIGDLLRFMLGLDSTDQRMKITSSEPEKDDAVSLEAFVSSLANIDCRWSEKRLEYVMKVISNQLKSRRGNGDGDGDVECVMSRGELRDAARQYIGDTGLIDFLLKSINCVSLGDYVIRRTINPSTRLLEFSITARKEESSAFMYSHLVHESRWPKKRLEYAVEVILNILKERKNAMLRQELRDAARVYVGDTGLIDYVLKSIDGFVSGHQIVSRSRNSSTKMIEFAVIDNYSSPSPSSPPPDMEMIYNDVLFVYENVLLDYPESDSAVSLASRVVLCSKNFVKEEWEVEETDDEFVMTLTCQVLPSFDELESELTRPLPPGELVRIPADITIGELKLAAQEAFRDTYCLMEKFEVKQIGGLKGLEDGVVLSCAVKSGAHVWVRGCGLDLCTPLRYQSG